MDQGCPCPEDGDFFDARQGICRNRGLGGHQQVYQWLGEPGACWPRLGGLSVEMTGARKEAAQKERLLRDAETRWRRKADEA